MITKTSTKTSGKLARDARRTVALLLTTSASVSCGHRGPSVSGENKGPLPAVKLCMPVSPPTGFAPTLSILSPEELAVTTGPYRDARGVLETGVSRRAWSHDSKRIAVQSSTGLVGIWDIASKKLTAMLPVSASIAEQMVWSTNDDAIAIAGNTDALRWDLTSGEPTLALSSVRYPRPLWRDDAEALLMPTASGAAEILDGKTGALVARLSTSANPVYQGQSPRVADTARTGILVTTSVTSGHQFWDWKTGTSLGTLPQPTRPGSSLKTYSISPDRHWFALADDATMYLLDARARRTIGTFSLDAFDLARSTTLATARGLCAWSPDGTQLAVLARPDSPVAYVYDLQQGQLRGTARFAALSKISQITWDPGGTRVIASGSPDVSTVSKLGRTSMLEQSWMLDAPTAPKPDPKKEPKPKKPPTPKPVPKPAKPVKPVKPGYPGYPAPRPVPPPTVPSAPPEPVSVPPPTLGALAEPRVISDRDELIRFAHRRPLSACLPDVSPDGNLVAVEGDSNELVLRDARTDAERLVIKPRSVTLGHITDFVPSPTGEPAQVIDIRGPGAYLLESGALVPLGNLGSAEALAWRPDGQAVVGGGAGWLRVWSRHESAGPFYRGNGSGSAAHEKTLRVLWSKPTAIPSGKSPSKSKPAVSPAAPLDAGASVGTNESIVTLSRADREATLELWDPSAGWRGILATYDADATDHSGALRFTKDGALLVGIGSILETWEIAPLSPASTVPGAETPSRDSMRMPGVTRKDSTPLPVEYIRGIVPDARRVIGETTEGELVVLDRATLRVVSTLARPGLDKNSLGTSTLSFGHDSTRVAGVIEAVGGWRARAWRIEDGALLSEIAGGGPVPRLRWSVDGKELYVLNDEKMQIVRLDGCSTLDVTPITVDGTAFLVPTSPDGHFDAPEQVVEVLSLTRKDGDRPRRYLLGPVLKSYLSPGLWTPATIPTKP